MDRTVGRRGNKQWLVLTQLQGQGTLQNGGIELPINRRIHKWMKTPMYCRGKNRL